MKWMLRIAVVLLASSTFAFVAPPTLSSQAQSAPSLTVTPNAGLVGGDVVTVAGSGFAPSSLVGFCEGRLDPNPSVSDCAGGLTHTAMTNSDGEFGDSLQVARFITPTSTHTTIDCAQSVQCGIGAATSPSGPFGVAPLSFAPQAPATFAITGSVIGPVPDENPVAGAAVWAYTASDSWVGSLQTVTDGNGAYQLDINPAVTYVVRFGPPAGTDLIAEWWQNRDRRSTAYPVHFPSAFNDPMMTLNQQLAAGGGIAGVVTVWAYGPGDTWVGRWGAKTGADGSYRIPGVPLEPVKVRFMPPTTSGLAIQWYNNATLRADATSVTVTTGATTTGINAKLSPSP